MDEWDVNWEGDWSSVSSYVQNLVPLPGGGLPGLPLPWPKTVHVLVGRRVELAVESGVVELGDKEPVDFAHEVCRKIGEVLDQLPEDRSQATVTLLPKYEEEGAVGADPHVRMFTRTAASVQAHRSILGPSTPFGAARDAVTTVAATRALPSPGFNGDQSMETDPYGDPRGYASSPYEDSVQPRNIEESMIMQLFRVQRDSSVSQDRRHEIAMQRASEQNLALTNQLMGLFTTITENISRDAERFGAEAAQARAAHNTTNVHLAEIQKERDMLQIQIEMLEDQLSVKDEEIEGVKRKKRRPPEDSAMGMLQGLAQQVMALREMMPGAQNQQLPETPAPIPQKRKRPRKIPGAPRSVAPPAAPVVVPVVPEPVSPLAAGLGGLGSMLSGGLDPTMIAGVISALPEGMRNNIVSELVKQSPGVAVNLAEELMDESDRSSRKLLRESGIEVDEDEDEYDEDDYYDDDEDEGEDDEDFDEEEEGEDEGEEGEPDGDEK